MDSIFKLTNGGEVKYIASSLIAYVDDTANESVKYTSALVNINPNKVESRHCAELTGDFVTYAQELENANHQTSTFTTQASYTFDAGMSY